MGAPPFDHNPRSCGCLDCIHERKRRQALADRMADAQRSPRDLGDVLAMEAGDPRAVRCIRCGDADATAADELCDPCRSRVDSDYLEERREREVLRDKGPSAALPDALRGKASSAPEPDALRGKGYEPCSTCGTVCNHHCGAKAVLADREAELLGLKGPCTNCRLHYAHSGPCAPPADGGWSTPAGANSEPPTYRLSHRATVADSEDVAESEPVTQRDGGEGSSRTVTEAGQPPLRPNSLSTVDSDQANLLVRGLINRARTPLPIDVDASARPDITAPITLGEPPDFTLSQGDTERQTRANAESLAREALSIVDGIADIVLGIGDTVIGVDRLRSNVSRLRSIMRALVIGARIDPVRTLQRRMDSFETLLNDTAMRVQALETKGFSDGD